MRFKGVVVQEDIASSPELSPPLEEGTWKRWAAALPPEEALFRGEEPLVTAENLARGGFKPRSQSLLPSSLPSWSLLLLLASSSLVSLPTSRPSDSDPLSLSGD